jgi:HEAT repeat protein
VKYTRLLHRTIAVVAVALGFAVASAAAQDADEDLIQLVVNLLGENDKDLRALGLEQVRTEAKGEAATRRFAAQLPKLPADAQVGLLRALADRGDKAARPAVFDMLKTKRDESVRVAAIAALGGLGEKADLRLLLELLAEGPKAEQDAARTNLVGMRGDAISAAIAAEMKQAASPIRVALIEILATRRALDTIPDLLSVAIDADAKVRTAAMVALGQIAGPEHTPGMVRAVLKAKPGTEREAAEKAIMFVCGRIPDAQKRADPLLAAMESLNETDRTALLPTLGRVGGPHALKVVEAAIANARRHEAGLRALCNWPDASVAARLIELAQSDEHADHRSMALGALIRVAPLPDGRPDGEKLELVRKVMEMCKNNEQRKLMLKRSSAIRTVETLRFILPYLDQPQYAEQACESVVELAHHRGLREPNKAEFHQALDKVIETSKDAVVIERANRYKRDQTWVRPKEPRRP